MESISFLDTHVVIWLFDGLIDDFPLKAQRYIQNTKLKISPMVELELHYLHEIGKILVPPKKIITTLSNLIDLQIEDFSAIQTINTAKNLKWTRDPFDRLITAQAKASNMHLLTKDENIHKNYNKAIWS